VDSSVVGYDGNRNVRDEEQPVGPKEPNRKQGEETKQSRWGFRGMTVRDWLELLIVPLVLVGIGLLFEMQQANRQQAMEEQQQALEERRAEAEQELAEQRAQDEALQAYLDQMSQLMLERKLLEAEPGDPVHTLAQARTSTVILRLDAVHNESVTRFLLDSGLAVNSEASAGHRSTSPGLLSTIALTNATLSGAILPNANLSGADLSGANLRDADLREANLFNANLIRADLSGASLDGANLSDAILQEADLSDAYLPKANLGVANLIRADLSGASLDGANLSDAVLHAANLRRANLRGATALTDEKIAAASSLEGATMPDGQKYEDWLKSNGKGEK
jgi:uncharacterized protein YjbI with pentapeptide repeats